jgi:hypothetical protein
MIETDVSDARPVKELAARTLAEPQWVPPAGILIGYARCSTEKQDLTAQREILRGLGVAEERVYLDHGLTGTTRSRPGLNSALAALREGDTLVVPKLDRLARSVPDARAIGDSLAARGVRLSLGGSVYDPSDPMGKCFFNILATFAEFEVDLLRMRTREGMSSPNCFPSVAPQSIASSHDRPPRILPPTFAKRSRLRLRLHRRTPSAGSSCLAEIARSRRPRSMVEAR